MPLLRRRRRTPAPNAAPSTALQITPGAFATIEAGNTLLPFIATPPGQGAAARQAVAKVQTASYAYIYRTQPAVRKVVDYIARNASQVGVRVYERVGESDRREAPDHPAALSLRRPTPGMGGRRFLYGLIADFLVYDNAYAIKFRRRNLDRRAFLRVPVWAVESLADPATDLVEGYRVHLKSGDIREFAADDVLHLTGYNPDDAGVGVSRLETLRMILTEEAANQAASVERQKRGGLGPGYIKRPLEAPEWEEEETRERFEVDWAKRSRGKDQDGARRDPVLEEGMEFVESTVTPRDAEALRSRVFTRAEVASLYGLPAVLVEANEKGTDREEARTQFYADCLPPVVDPIAEDLDVQVLEAEYGATDHYFEFDLAAKLKGQTGALYKTLVSAAGAPIITRNEGRAVVNLPEVAGGDELITPMNVTVGAKPSPAVMPAQDPNGPSQDGDERPDDDPPAAKRALEVETAERAVAAQAELIARREAQATRRDRYADEHAELLRKAFARQERVYRSSGVFDLDRWDGELADDLEAKALEVVEREGGIAAERLAIAAGFDLDRCRNYLRAGAEEKAHAINTTTATALERDAEDETEATAEVTERQDAFEHAKGERAEEGGVAIATSLAAFSHLEAGRQAPDAPTRLKTWIVTAAGNSRHPEMGGQSVPLFEAFSNGGQHPGDPKLGADETARCKCLLEVS